MNRVAAAQASHSSKITAYLPAANRRRSPADQLSVAERVANSLRVEQPRYKMEKRPYDFDAAFCSLAVRAPQMLLVLFTPLFALQRSRIVELAAQYRLPTMLTLKAYVEVGGLMYSVDPRPMWRRAASSVAAILRNQRIENKSELAAAFDRLRSLGVEGVAITSDPLFNSHPARFAERL